jgi:hypothetical protein
MAKVNDNPECSIAHTPSYEPCYTGYYAMFEGKERHVVVLTTVSRSWGADDLQVRSLSEGSKLGIVLDVIGSERHVLLFKGASNRIMPLDVWSCPTWVIRAERDKLFDYEDVWSDLVGWMSCVLRNICDQINEPLDEFDEAA